MGGLSLRNDLPAEAQPLVAPLAEENGIVLSFGIYGGTRAEQQRRCQDQNWRGGRLSAEQLAPERCVRCSTGHDSRQNSRQNRAISRCGEETSPGRHVANEAGTRCVPC
jgi:hypothetical protein